MLHIETRANCKRKQKIRLANFNNKHCNWFFFYVTNLFRAEFGTHFLCGKRPIWNKLNQTQNENLKVDSLMAIASLIKTDNFGQLHLEFYTTLPDSASHFSILDAGFLVGEKDPGCCLVRYWFVTVSVIIVFFTKPLQSVTCDFRWYWALQLLECKPISCSIKLVPCSEEVFLICL